MDEFYLPSPLGWFKLYLKWLGRRRWELETSRKLLFFSGSLDSLLSFYSCTARQQQRRRDGWYGDGEHSSAQCRMYTFGESLIFVTTSIPNNEYMLAFCLSTHIIKNTKPFCKLHSMAIFPSAFLLSSLLFSAYNFVSSAIYGEEAAAAEPE